jgi:hypothetical protein
LRSYLLSLVVVVENRNLHLLDVIQELLFIPSESWSKQQIKVNTKKRYESPTKVHKEPRVPSHSLFRDSPSRKLLHDGHGIVPSLSHLNYLDKLRLQTAHLKGQLLLSLTQAKEARVIPRE